MAAVIQDGAPGLDQTAEIQAAVINHKVIRFPACDHPRLVTSQISMPGPRSLLGESEVYSRINKTHPDATFRWDGVDCQGSEISRLVIEGSGTGIGLWFGSNIEHTSHVTISQVRLHNLWRGIDGDGTFTLFDSHIEKVDFFGCNNYGMKLSGSQITADHCSFRLCDWGIYVQGQPQGYSIGGGVFNGGLSIGNDFDIVIGSPTVRQLEFHRMWFEQTKAITLGRDQAYPEIFFQGLSFNRCLFQPAATAGGNGILDVSGIKGSMDFNRCVVFADLNAAATIPTLASGDSNAIYSRTGCYKVAQFGAVSKLADYKN